LLKVRISGQIKKIPDSQVATRSLTEESKHAVLFATHVVS